MNLESCETYFNMISGIFRIARPEILNLEKIFQIGGKVDQFRLNTPEI